MPTDNKTNFGRDYFLESVDESTLEGKSSDVRVEVDQLTCISTMMQIL